MKGFFTKQETQSKSRPDGKIYSCSGCGLLKNVETPIMKPYGKGDKRILIVMDYPSKLDDERGKPLTDKHGRMIKREFRKNGIDLFRDCWVTHSMRCYPGSRKTNLLYELACCRRFLTKTIEELQPHVIIAFGKLALLSLIGHRWKKDFGEFSKWRGWAIPDQEFKAWICPIRNPKELHDNPVYNLQWQKDIANACTKSEIKFLKWKKPTIHFVKNLSFIRQIKDGQTIAIDYETTGIKPHASGHRIICIAVAVNENTSFVFMVPKDVTKLKRYCALLKNAQIGKLAQNMKYEDNWSNEILKTQVNGWEFDSMLASHVMDNRESITGLKFQTYVQFGIIDYDSEIEPYLKADNSNAINRVPELIKTREGKEKLMYYCGMDTIVQYRLSLLQQQTMNYSFLPF